MESIGIHDGESMEIYSNPWDHGDGWWWWRMMMTIVHDDNVWRWWWCVMMMIVTMMMMMDGEWWLIVDAMTMSMVMIIIMMSSSSWIDLHDIGALSWNLPIPIGSHGSHGSPRIQSFSIDQHGILRVLMNRSRTTPLGRFPSKSFPCSESDRIYN